MIQTFDVGELHQRHSCRNNKGQGEADDGQRNGHGQTRDQNLREGIHKETPKFRIKHRCHVPFRKQFLTYSILNLSELHKSFLQV